MRALCVLLTSIMLTTPALAEVFWLSDPGYCGSDFAMIEDDSIMVLDATGIRTHTFSCDWSPLAGQAIVAGTQYVTAAAQCANATTTWSAALETVTLQSGDIRVFQDGGGLSPVLFHRCDTEGLFQE